jgi:endo-1,4-beta-xylanase
MDAHIDRVVGRYAGRVHSWDVVNEPFWPGHGLPGGFRQGPWYAAMGPGYVARAFRRAAQADPATRLVLNEAQTEGDDALGLAIRADLLRLIDDLQDAGVPLHAVGLESHIQPQRPFDAGRFAAFLAALAARGLAIYVTELDVDDHRFPDATGRRDALVAEGYARYLATVLAEPAVTVVQTWGLSDAYSWYRSPNVMAALDSTRAARPLPFDATFAEKPAAQALAAAFAARAAKSHAGSTDAGKNHRQIAPE